MPLFKKFPRWNPLTYLLEYHNSQREMADEVGWGTVALPPGAPLGLGYSTPLNLAANGGTLVVPIMVIGHHLFDSLMVRSSDTGTARSAEWRLYRQRLNNGNAGENAVDQVTNAAGTYSFTPSAASNRNSQTGSAPIYLAPGMYLLAVRNTSATQTFGIGTNASAGLVPNVMQTKTLAGALDTTLDIIAATWTKTGAVPGVALMSRIGGDTAFF